MDQSTSPEAGPFDVRTALLNIIGSRSSGISHQELMRAMRGSTEWRTPFRYETTLVSLIKDGKVAVTHCGMANHKTRIYLLCTNDQYQKTCRVCKLTKSALAFRKRPDSKDGYLTQCKLCENQQRREKGWANKSRKRKQEESKNGQDKKPVYSNMPRVIIEKEELDARVKAAKVESLEDYRLKFTGKTRYVVVDGKIVPAPGHEPSPVEEYDRAWRRIRVK